MFKILISTLIDKPFIKNGCKSLSVFLFIILLNTILIAQGQTVDQLNKYNVVWNSPSMNSSGTMPIGNGDIGLNVWVDEGGDLLFYLARNDSWRENGRLLKLGRVRVKLSPNPFVKGLPFSQELKLRDSEIEIVAGQKESEVTIKVWVDANNPVVWVEAVGNHPIKFNGYMYTVETPEGDNDPDWRRWGPGIWFMNTRALYWPMFTSGDHAFFDAYFNLYMNALPMAKERTKTYYGHEGAYIPEQIYFWGGYLTDHYGWDRTDRDPSFVEVRWTARLWQGILELLLIMNDYYIHTEDEEFLKTKLLPMADEAITFYDSHYKRDENGKLYIWPAQSLEAWWDCVNPMPEVAGLRSILDKLLKLPEKYTRPEQRQKWERLLSEVPELPTRKLENGKTILAPAEKFAERANRENCELYAVFPYRLLGVGKPNLKLAQLTYENPFQDHFDNGVYVAFLGLVDEARDFVKSWSHPPDMTNNWANVPIRFKHQNLENFPLAYMSLLQAMLIQYDDRKIFLFPTWPKEWDVEFKLHAPYNTIVEGTYKNGNLEYLKVTPKSRMKDVVKMQEW